MSTSARMLWSCCSYLPANSCCSSSRWKSDLTWKQRDWMDQVRLAVLLGWTFTDCTSEFFCTSSFRETIKSSSLRLSRFRTSCISVSQSLFCCLIIRSICLISSWSSGSQEERTRLEAKYFSLAPGCQKRKTTFYEFKRLYLRSIFSWECWRASMSVKPIQARRIKKNLIRRYPSSKKLSPQFLPAKTPLVEILLPVYTK